MVAAVVVGGVAIFGGSGSVYGAALGAVLLTTIGSALPVLGINPFWQRAAVGALILAAIGLDRALALRVRPARSCREGEGAHDELSTATEQRPAVAPGAASAAWAPGTSWSCSPWCSWSSSARPPSTASPAPGSGGS